LGSPLTTHGSSRSAISACSWDDARAAEVRRQGKLEAALQRQMVLQKQLQEQLEVICLRLLILTYPGAIIHYLAGICNKASS